MGKPSGPPVGADAELGVGADAVDVMVELDGVLLIAGAECGGIELPARGTTVMLLN